MPTDLENLVGGFERLRLGITYISRELALILEENE